MFFYLVMAQHDPVRRLVELGFEIINNTEDVVVCKLEPIGPEPDDGRWIALYEILAVLLI
jgi:hypothetical protein